MTRTLRTRLAALAAAGGLAGAAHAQEPVGPANPVAPPVTVPADPGVEKAVPLPAAPAAPAARPQVIRWPGGYMVMNGPEVIVRHAGPPAGGVNVRGTRSTNVVTNSGNGFGNTIVVSNGSGGGGVTVVRNARNGVGNRLIVDPDDLLLDADELGLDGIPGLDLLPVPFKPAPADPVVAPKMPADPLLDPAAGAIPAPAAVRVYKGKANPFWEKKAWSDAHDCNLYWSPADKAWFRYSSEDDVYRPVPPATAPAPPAAPAAPVPDGPELPVIAR